MLNWSQHCLERYAERIHDKEGLEIKQFVQQKQDMIKDNLQKLFDSSELFYEGYLRDHKFAYFYMNKHGWVFIIAGNKTDVITLYKIDLKLGDDFNAEFMRLNIEMINKLKEDKKNTESKNTEEEKVHISEIDSNKRKIDEYKKLIKALEDDTTARQALIVSAKGKANEIDMELKERVEALVSAKIF